MKMPVGNKRSIDGIDLMPRITKAAILLRFCRLLVLAGALFLYLQTDEAHADFRICNDTENLVGAALGYREDGEWISEGWFQIAGNNCASLIEGDLGSRFYYIYAEEAERGGQWRGKIFMCTNEREFRIAGVKDCFKRGHLRTGFFEIDTGGRNSWMVRLTETAQPATVQ